jgi:transposase
MAKNGPKQGSTLRAVKMAQEEGLTIEEISRITGKSVSSLRSSASRINTRLISESPRIMRGMLKEQLFEMDTMKYTAREAADMLGTSIYTIYSLGARYNRNFKTAPYGSQKGVNYSIYGKTSKVQTNNKTTKGRT